MKITKEMLISLAKSAYLNGQVDGIAGRHTEFEESLAQIALDTVLELMEVTTKRNRVK